MRSDNNPGMNEPGKTWAGVLAIIVVSCITGYVFGTFIRAKDLEQYRKVMRSKVSDMAEATRATDAAEASAIASIESLSEDMERFRDGSTDWKDVVGDVESTMETLVGEVETLKEAAAKETAALIALKRSAEKEPGTPTYED